MKPRWNTSGDSVPRCNQWEQALRGQQISIRNNPHGFPLVIDHNNPAQRRVLHFLQNFQERCLQGNPWHRCDGHVANGVGKRGPRSTWKHIRYLWVSEVGTHKTLFCKNLSDKPCYSFIVKPLQN